MISSLDTSIIVRLCAGDVPEQVAAANQLVDSQTLAVADAAFVEAEHVLRTGYGFSRAEISQSYRDIMSHDTINCNRTLFEKALHYYEQYPTESLVDCCLTVYAELNKAVPLLTFDKNLAKHLPNAQLLTTT